MGNRPMVIGYLGRILPFFSETFVVREFAALRDLGAEVKPFSIRLPDRRAIHPEAPGLAGEVVVLGRPLNPLFWLAHLLFLVIHPVRYFRTLWRYVMAAREPLRRRLRSLVHFSMAPYAALRMRKAGVGHLHAHFANSPASVAMMTAELAAIPFSFTAHAYDLFVDDILLPAKLKAAAFVVAISHYNLNYFRDRFAEAEDAKIEIVRYCVNLDSLPPRPPPSNDPPVILAVGRLVGKKGFTTLVEACAHLNSSGLRADCFIIGEGPEREELEGLVENLRLADSVFLIGKLQQTEVREYYRRADLLAMPSCISNKDRDGIPNVLIEAMAMEIPVVSTSVSGIPELVRDGETGLVVEPNDPKVLSDAIARLLRDQVLARKLATAGRKLVIEKYNSRRSASRMFKLITGEEINRRAGTTE